VKRERAQYGSTSGGSSDTEDQSSRDDPQTTNPGGTSAGGHSSGGFSPGSQTPGYDPDPNIPYWDKAGHLRTHEKLSGRAEASYRARVERKWREHAYEDAYAGGGMLFQFVLVGSVVACVIGSASWMLGTREERQRKTVAGSNSHAAKRENG
jgi:hypothetical protein